MEVQLKRGSLEVCVLASLLKEDSYGYKIIQSLQEVVEISESTLYPILRRLEASNCLKSYSVEHNGRLRKFYSINEKGKDKILFVTFELGGVPHIEDLKTLIADETGTPLEQVTQDTNRDYWLDSEEAVKYGLISKIVTKRTDLPK